MTESSAPVRHVVWDDFVSPVADWSVPPENAPVWEARYDSDVERGKRTTRDLPAWAADVVQRMMFVMRTCARVFGEPLQADPLLWGGGLQVTSPGGYLGTHLDGSLHPKRPGLRRAVQLVCFVHPEWRDSWGGDLILTDPMGGVVTRIAPLPGRLVAFAATDLAYHGVERVTGPAERVTVACSLLAPARACDTRARALFLPRRG